MAKALKLWAVILKTFYNMSDKGFLSKIKLVSNQFHKKITLLFYKKFAFSDIFLEN